MPVHFFSGPNRLLAASLAVVLSIALAACSGGGGDQSDPADADFQITSVDLEFSTDVLEVPAGEPFTLAYTNEESAAHNVAIYREQGGESIFVGEVITGPDRTVIYEIPALEPGEYYFQCDIHPDMNGRVVAG